jgi:dUTPase
MTLYAAERVELYNWAPKYVDTGVVPMMPSEDWGDIYGHVHDLPSLLSHGLEIRPMVLDADMTTSIKVIVTYHQALDTTQAPPIRTLADYDGDPPPHKIIEKGSPIAQLVVTQFLNVIPTPFSASE